MATTENLGIEKIDGEANQAGVTGNEAFDILDAALALKTIALADGNYTLSISGAPAAEFQYGVLRFTGALTAGRNIVVPDNKKPYDVINATTGGFALTLKTLAGTGTAVASGKAARVACDGTNVVRLAPDTTP